DAPNRCTISGEGKGGAAGFAKGGAQVTLADGDAGATRLSYVVNASVGGKLAQIGSRLIDGVARKMADDFFTTFNRIVAQRPAAAAPPGATAPAPAARAAAAAAPPPPPQPAPADSRVAPTGAPMAGGLPTWAWVLGLVVIVALGLVWFTR